MAKKELLKQLPSVDEALKGHQGHVWLDQHARPHVVAAIREAIDGRRKSIIEGKSTEASLESLIPDIGAVLKSKSSLSLKKVINATGIVVHTNLGRSPLAASAMDNIVNVARGYSNLEYDLSEGKRGKRHSHIRRLIRETTGAEDGIAVNNNAAAVLIALSALARGREVIVSRGELVEIGGSFRVPAVMNESGAILKEVGTTNRTHPHDYEKAITENTALILKVHQSNYRIRGFTSEVDISGMAGIGRRHNIPVMFDMGSGCLIDLKKYGIHEEPTVSDAINAGADIVTFSGDKLLGGPQAGIIAGAKTYIETISKHPLARALRIDKLTLAALESTLMAYADPDKAVDAIPTLKMLLAKPEDIQARAKKLGSLIKKKSGANVKAEVVEDFGYSGGGALPDMKIKTCAVSVLIEGLTPNAIEERLRLSEPAVIGRIKDGMMLLDCRTINDSEMDAVAGIVAAVVRK